MRNICVIGGSRYFGKHLVELEREAGNKVTVINRGSTPRLPGTTRLVADRDDERQLREALGARTFDVVFDQVAYTPEQAATARRVFEGRTGRYVMTSTMEVYDPATFAALPTGPEGPLLAEDRLDLAALPPAREPSRAGDAPDPATAYAEGKRRAEAVLLTDPAFDTVTVRTAHVLGGGSADFTGRLAHYVERIAAGRPVDIHADPRPTSFVHHEEIARFLHWTGSGTFTGPVNAASHGALTVTELCDLIAAGTGRRPRYRTVPGGGAASPFSFDRSYAMDNGRAARLGFGFGRVEDWLPGAAAEARADALVRTG
ncbi:NAD-dependent epimerase/dehydratase family protein [Streptomyces sp. NBC_00536]|uniref:NAD-dependent epimerase/dehydratase family protein n=1 Tax=Streptomyces sp. NBC_00536 TaxID=2975769 RepID=UPI002E807B55|nr:NAD-dependent epimerase/dehydratase family protein [Streptomyces sp. NBC_00536]WUC77640.1 NAD-dependent epimerase/dehydratase family protein [Streptomyces sp. NBC_00536]